MEVLKGAVLNIEFGPFDVFSRVFFNPLRYDYPSDVTLVLWQYGSQYGSRIRGGLLMPLKFNSAGYLLYNWLFKKSPICMQQIGRRCAWRCRGRHYTWSWKNRILSTRCELIPQLSVLTWSAGLQQLQAFTGPQLPVSVARVDVLYSADRPTALNCVQPLSCHRNKLCPVRG